MVKTRGIHGHHDMALKALLAKWNKGIARGAQRKFAARIGVKEATVSHWAKGNFTPDENLRGKIASELGITLEELMDCFKPRGRHSHSGETGIGWDAHSRNIPVVGTIAGAAFTFRPDATPEEILPLTYTTAQKVIALKITGDSRVPSAKGMDYAVISLQDHAETGQMVLVSKDEKHSLSYLLKGASPKIAGVVRYFFKKP